MLFVYVLRRRSRALDPYIWYGKNSNGTTHPVGQKKPNPYGLYDVYGNIGEYVQDWDINLPTDREITDYRGPSPGVGGVARGGHWFDEATGCRSTSRTVFRNRTRGPNGFRVVFAMEEELAPVAEVESGMYTNSIGMKFVPIPAGSSLISSSDLPSNQPEQTATVSKPFYLGRYEVTQAQWTEVMEDNPSKFKGRDNPVEQVSWDDVQEFIARLNAKEGHARYRLPTEEEWAYAALAGRKSFYGIGADLEKLGYVAWYHTNSGGKTHPVGKKKPNAWGLYDMIGNVGEWVQNEEFESKGRGFVYLGGSYDISSDPDILRNQIRSTYGSSNVPGSGVGFRLAFSPE